MYRIFYHPVDSYFGAYLSCEDLHEAQKEGCADLLNAAVHQPVFLAEGKVGQYLESI